MTQISENTMQGLHPGPIRLQPIELRPDRLLSNGEEFDALSSLAHFLAVQCINCMLDVVQNRNPLAEPEYSSIIWLRSDGRIELVSEKHYRDRNYEDLLSDSLYVEAFRSITDAIPASAFHRCIEDSNGDLIGDIKGRTICIKPKWDCARSIAASDAYAASIARISLDRMRIEALGQPEALKVLTRNRYKESLQQRILGWLIAGKYPACLERLSAYALRRVGEQPGVVLVFGKERFNRALAAKTRQALVRNLMA